MVQAGVQVHEDVTSGFKDIYSKKARFVVAKMNDDATEIVLETKGERTATFDDFKAAIP